MKTISPLSPPQTASLVKLASRRTRAYSETGSAMVMVLLVMVVLTGMGAVIFNISSANLQNAGRDRFAGGAMGAAEAGIAHAVAHMRANGTGTLTCDGPLPGSALCTNPWGYNYPTSGAGGQSISLDSSRQYKVWIQKLAAYSPVAGSMQGRYLVHSVGSAGNGPGSRTITTEVSTEPFKYPVGVFGRDYVRNAAQTSVSKESVFSLGCIGKRDHMSFDANSVDLAHPELIPAAHSASYTSSAQILGAVDTSCSANQSQNIHAPSKGPCNLRYKYDRDLQGGPLGGTSCAAPLGGRSLTSSKFDENMLKSYGYTEPRGLPVNQYDFLKQKAREQGNYYDCVASPRSGACAPSGNMGSITTLNGATQPNAVLYIRLSPGKSVALGPSNLVGYDGSPTNAPGTACGSRSLLIVVEGGDLNLVQGLQVVGVFFVPDGKALVAGGVNITGTLFAKELYVTGDAGFTLEGQCFFDNLPGGALKVMPTNFREVDR